MFALPIERYDRVLGGYIWIRTRIEVSLASLLHVKEKESLSDYRVHLFQDDNPPQPSKVPRRGDWFVQGRLQSECPEQMVESVPARNDSKVEHQENDSC